MSDYAPPLDRIASRGGNPDEEAWPDYVAEFGLGPEHVPDLLRMVRDRALIDRGGEAAWASIHARRALGQLGDASAAGPLLESMDAQSEDDGYWLEEMPEVLARMGPEVLPTLARRLAEPRPDFYTRVACSTALAKLGASHPEARPACVAALAEQLTKHEDGEDGWSLNGFIVGDLLDLKAVESASVIEAAYEADVVDETICGGWPDVRYELGLGPRPRRSTMRPQWGYPPLPSPPRRPDPARLLKRSRAPKSKAPRRRR